MPNETSTDVELDTTEDREAKKTVSHLTAIAKLASNPAALVVYAVLAGGGSGYLGGSFEEDLDDHVHEEDKVPELRRHWTTDERRALESRLASIERKLEEPVEFRADRELEERIRELEVEIRSAVRLLELQNGPTNGGSPP